MKKLFLFISLIGLISCNPSKDDDPILNVSSGHIERIDNFSSMYVSDRNVDIWLPDGYKKNKKYAVLYMHDGQMLYDSTTTWNHQEWGVDETMSKMIDEKEINNTIVVGVWNAGPEGRHSDYFPQKPFESLESSYRDSLLQNLKRDENTKLFQGDVHSDNYLKFLVEELKPHIDANYSTYTDKAHTFVAGSSMGGLISMYAICEYPEVFGGAACMSTHWPGIFDTINNPIPDAFADYMEKNLPSPADHKIYFDYGTETLDALYEPYQLHVDKVMEQAGFDEFSWRTVKFEGDAHDETSWRKRLHVPFKFIMGVN